MGRPNPFREAKFSGANGGWEMLVFSAQLTTSRIGNLTRLIGIFISPVQLSTGRIGNLNRLIHTLLYVMTIHTYIHALL